MGFSRIARFLVAGAVVAGVAPLSPAPAQAANCDATVVVFTQTSVDLPEGVKNPRNGQDNLANPTLDSRGFGCTLSPDFEANT
ncbi:MAG TPA: hypothetical protein VNE62_06570, partial [Actinomycetota bacterium]|nr:hypothetical protein [Actinomycetota bacterium]